MSNSASTARPATVTASFYLWLVTVVIGLIEGIILLIASGSAEAASAAKTSMNVPSSAFVIGAIISIVLSLIQLVIVFQMKAKRNWARIVLLVLAILQVISIFTGGGTASWSSWVGLVAVIIATVLMFLPESNRCFRRTT